MALFKYFVAILVLFLSLFATAMGRPTGALTVWHLIQPKSFKRGKKFYSDWFEIRNLTNSHLMKSV